MMVHDHCRAGRHMYESFLTALSRPVDVQSPALQVLGRLSTYLPEEQRSPEALRALAHSPQFHHQLSTFSAALQTGQLDLAQFGLQAEVGDSGTPISMLLSFHQTGSSNISTFTSDITM